MTDEITTPEKEPVFATFLGGDERFWDGVPARNLTESEWNAITNENIKTHLLSSSLYKLVKKAGK